MAFLHDDGKDDALVNADLGALEDGVLDLFSVSGGVLAHVDEPLVDVPHFLERDPVLHWGELVPGAGEVMWGRHGWLIEVDEESTWGCGLRL